MIFVDLVSFPRSIFRRWPVDGAAHGIDVGNLSFKRPHSRTHWDHMGATLHWPLHHSSSSQGPERLSWATLSLVIYRLIGLAINKGGWIGWWRSELANLVLFASFAWKLCVSFGSFYLKIECGKYPFRAEISHQWNSWWMTPTAMNGWSCNGNHSFHLAEGNCQCCAGGAAKCLGFYFCPIVSSLDDCKTICEVWTTMSSDKAPSCLDHKDWITMNYYEEYENPYYPTKIQRNVFLFYFPPNTFGDTKWQPWFFRTKTLVWCIFRRSWHFEFVSRCGILWWLGEGWSRCWLKSTLVRFKRVSTLDRHI